MAAAQRFRAWLFGNIRRALFLLPLAGLLPMLLFQGWIFVRWIEHERGDALEGNLETARSFAAIFDAYIEAALSEEEAVGVVLASADSPPALRARLLDAAVRRFPSWDDLLWLTPSGQVLSAARSRAEGLQLGDRPYFVAIRGGRAWAVSDLLPSRTNGRLVFVIARGVRDPGGRLLGVMAALVDRSRLGDRLSVERGSGGAVLLLDRKGALTYRRPWVEATGPETSWAATVPAVKESLLGRETWFVARAPLDQQRRTFAAVPVPSLGWVVIASQPLAAALAPALSEVGRSVAGLALAAAVGLWLAHIVSTAVVKPTQRLQEHAAAVGRGEFHRRVDCAQAPRELQLVADTLNRMAERLEAREEERERAQEALRLSEERLRISNEAARIGTWDWDLVAGTITGDSRSNEFLGLTPDSVSTAAQFLSLVHPDDRAVVEETVRRAKEGEGNYEAEYRMVRTDGAMRWVLARGRVLGNDPGGARRLVGVILDVTRRKEYEAALARAQAAEVADRAKSEFMAVASHELHTPLNAVLGYSDLLLDEVDGPLTADQRKSVERIASNGRRLVRVADAMLDLSRLQAGTLDLDQTGFGLRERLADGVQPYAERGREKGLELTWSVTSNVPDRLRGDPDRLIQALAILLDNAVTFTQHGRVTLTVRTDWAFWRHECLRFAVEDTGVGIPPEQQSRIFLPFQQGEAADTRSHEGLGVGLSIASALAAQMGGRLSVESESGRGSTFSFTACFELVEEDQDRTLASRAQGEGRPVPVAVEPFSPRNS